MGDILESLRNAGFEPEVNKEDGFKPLTGKFVVRIDTAGRIKGLSKKTQEPYDFYSVNTQVVEVIDGDNAVNRFVKMTYNPDEEGTKKLLNDLFTSGITVEAKTEAELEEFLGTLKDKTMNLRCWVWTPDKDKAGNTIAEEDRKGFQQIKVVKEFKGKVKSDIASSNVPF